MMPPGADVLADEPPSTPENPTSPGAISRRGLVGAAALIAVGNVLSRALGLLREQVIAAMFGATAGTDAYVVARTVPLILYDLLIGNVITAAFVPVFVQFTRDRRALWSVVSAIFSLVALALAVISGVLMVLAEPLVWVLAGGWAPDQRELGTAMTRIALVSVVFQGMAGLLTSVLYAQNRFLLPAFSVATYNALVIVGVLTLAGALGVKALVVGLVAGALGQFLLQAAGLREFWRSFRPRVDLDDPAVRRVLALYAPVGAGMLVTIAGYVLDRNLASRLTPGSLSSMQYATTLIQFPLGMVGLAASFAVMPTLSRFGKGEEENLERYREALLFGMKLILLLILPLLALLAALAHPIVALLFERGRFTAADTSLTASILLGYAPQLPFTAVDYLLINAFYARQDTRTPVLVGVVGTLLYLVVALLLIQPLGAVGLALANATQNSVHAIVLALLLRRALPGLRMGQALAPFLVRAIPAAVVAGVLAGLAWSFVLDATGLLVALAAAGLLGLAVYATLLYAFRTPELRSALGALRRPALP